MKLNKKFLVQYQKDKGIYYLYKRFLWFFWTELVFYKIGGYRKPKYVALVMEGGCRDFWNFKIKHDLNNSIIKQYNSVQDYKTNNAEFFI